MRLTVVTPQGSKLAVTASSVTVPGTVGELGILPGHRALITSLAVGKLAYVAEGKTHYLATNEGFMEVHDDHVTIVTQSAEVPDAIDVARAKKALESAERELAETPASREVAYRTVRLRRARALNRIRVAEQHATPAALRQVRDKPAK